jgi:hypothetical protein
MTDTVVRRLIKTDGSIEVLGGAMSKTALQILLCANELDALNLGTGMVMLADIDGIERNLPINPLATEIYHRRANPGANMIHGDVVIVADSDFGGVH